MDNPLQMEVLKGSASRNEGVSNTLFDYEWVPQFDQFGCMRLNSRWFNKMFLDRPTSNAGRSLLSFCTTLDAQDALTTQRKSSDMSDPWVHVSITKIIFLFFILFIIVVVANSMTFKQCIQHFTFFLIPVFHMVPLSEEERFPKKRAVLRLSLVVKSIQHSTKKRSCSSVWPCHLLCRPYKKMISFGGKIHHLWILYDLIVSIIDHFLSYRPSYSSEFPASHR